MLNVGKLKEICEYLEKEYGSDVPVIIQLYDNKQNLINGDYVLDYSHDNNGTLFLSNNISKSVKVENK